MSMFFFFAFLELVEPAPTEYCFFCCQVFNAVNVDVSKFKDYTSRSDKSFGVVFGSDMLFFFSPATNPEREADV